MIDRIWRDRLAIGEFLIPTGANPSLVAPIATLIKTRNRARKAAKRALNLVRAYRENKR
jgi:hypothetical protein